MESKTVFQDNLATTADRFRTGQVPSVERVQLDADALTVHMGSSIAPPADAYISGPYLTFRFQMLLELVAIAPERHKQMRIAWSSRSARWMCL